MHWHTAFKIAVLLVCLYLIGVTLKPRITHVTSIDGVIGTDLVTLFSGVSGIVIFSSEIGPGSVVSKGSPIYSITQGPLDNIEIFSQYSALKDRIHSLEADWMSLEIELGQLTNDRERFASLVTANSASQQRLEQVQMSHKRVSGLLRLKGQYAEDARSDLVSIAKQMQLLEHEQGVAPFDLVVWSIVARSAEFRASNSPLLRVFDRRRLWVDAYFSEKHVDRLDVGALVVVEVVSSGEKFEGNVLFVRAGVGRFSFDSPTRSPTDKSRNRMVVTRISIDPKGVFGAHEFFGIGRSVRVKLPR